MVIVFSLVDSSLFRHSGQTDDDGDGSKEAAPNRMMFRRKVRKRILAARVLRTIIASSSRAIRRATAARIWPAQVSASDQERVREWKNLAPREKIRSARRKNQAPVRRGVGVSLPPPRCGEDLQLPNWQQTVNKSPIRHRLEI